MVLSVVRGDSARGNKHKLKYRKFCLNISKNFYTVRGVKHWLPTEAVESPCMAMFKTGQDTALSSLVDFTLTSRVGLDALQRCLPASVIL